MMMMEETYVLRLPNGLEQIVKIIEEIDANKVKVEVVNDEFFTTRTVQRDWLSAMKREIYAAVIILDNTANGMGQGICKGQFDAAKREALEFSQVHGPWKDMKVVHMIPGALTAAYYRTGKADDVINIVPQFFAPKQWTWTRSNGFLRLAVSDLIPESDIAKRVVLAPWVYDGTDSFASVDEHGASEIDLITHNCEVGDGVWQVNLHSWARPHVKLHLEYLMESGTLSRIILYIDEKDKRKDDAKFFADEDGKQNVSLSVRSDEQQQQFQIKLMWNGKSTKVFLAETIEDEYMILRAIRDNFNADMVVYSVLSENPLVFQNREKAYFSFSMKDADQTEMYQLKKQAWKSLDRNYKIGVLNDYVSVVYHVKSNGMVSVIAIILHPSKDGKSNPKRVKEHI